MVKIYKPVKPLTSGSQGMLVVPKIGTKRYGGKGTLCCSDIDTLWNDLQSTENSRDGGLKPYFFRQYFYRN